MRLAAIALWGAATSCQALYGGHAMDNPDNCSRNGQLCAAPDQACNQLSKLCEPAIVLTSISPSGASNIGGTSITLTGKLLTPDLTVLIAGSPAQVVPTPGGGSDQLTVIVPPNPTKKGPVSVELIHPAGQRQQRSDLFLYYSPLLFAETLTPGTNSLIDILGGDFNGDGRSDVVVCYYGNTPLAFFAGKGDGTFAAPVLSKYSASAFSCRAADVNGDGNLDIVVNEGQSGPIPQVEVLLGNGSGTFQRQPVIQISYRMRILALSDLNGDGKPDMVAAEGSMFHVHLNDGSGRFGSSTSYSVFAGNTQMLFGLFDVNSDGAMDVVSTNSIDQYVAVSYGDGHGNFDSSPTLIPVPLPASQPSVGDLNGDGRPDLLVNLVSNAQVAILLREADGTWAPPSLMALPMMGTAVSFLMRDLNGDGTLDLAWYGVQTDNNFGTFTGLGDGTFVDAQVSTEGQALNGMVIADFDGDQRPDVILAEVIAKQFRVLLNKTK